MFSRTCLVSALSSEKGPPGAMRMIKKLSVIMMKRVGMRPRNLRMMYFVIRINSSYCLTAKAQRTQRNKVNLCVLPVYRQAGATAVNMNDFTLLLQRNGLCGMNVQDIG